MYRCQHVIAHHTLRDDDCILVVVTLPRHISNQKVTTQSQLTILSSVALSQDVTLLHTLSLVADRTQVDSHVLVGTAELRNAVFLESRLEADKLLVFRTVIENTDGSSVDVLDDTFTFGSDHRTAILTDLLLQTRTYNRCVIMEQRYCLTHHVTSHQSTVTVIMLQERNQAGTHRGDLLR